MESEEKPEANLFKGVDWLQLDSICASLALQLLRGPEIGLDAQIEARLRPPSIGLI